MIFQAITLLLQVSVVTTPEAQAEVLLNHVTIPEITMYTWRVAMDDSGFVWLLGEKNYSAWASRISPDGQFVFEKVPIPDADYFARELIFDRWLNAYFIAVSEEGHNYSRPFLCRITPSGEVQTYSWPLEQTSGVEAYLGILPGDTLYEVGHDRNSRGYRYAKAIINQDGMTPLDESTHPNRQGVFTYHLFTGNHKGLITSWEKGVGFFAFIYPYTTGRILSIIRLNMTEEQNYSATELGDFEWPEYSWREYPDVFIGKITITEHKDGGYCLYAPDYIDSSSTHVIRLSADGIPIQPSELTNGGTLDAYPFEQIPQDVEPQVHLRVWTNYRIRLAPDSAMVVFWGCDDEGNLYAYSKTRRF